LSPPKTNYDDDEKKPRREEIVFERKSDDLLRDMIDFGKALVVAEELSYNKKTLINVDKQHVIPIHQRDLVLRDRDVFINKTNYTIGQAFTRHFECDKYDAHDGKVVELSLYSVSNDYSVYIERDGAVIVDDTFATLQNKSLAIESIVADQDVNDRYILSITDWSFKNSFYFGITPTTPGMLFDTLWCWIKFFVWE